MSDALKSYDPHRFRTTAPYYARYRLAYPELLIARVVDIVGLKPGDNVMDLGCGPGTLTIPFAKAGMKVLAVDPEPAMLALAREAAREAGVRIESRQGGSFDLPSGIGLFELVTMGRSFHWMDRTATLVALDTLVAADGAVVLFDDEHPRTVENAWRRTLEEIGCRYGRSEEAHIQERDSAGYRTHESFLLASAFNRLERVSVIVQRSLTADDIVGLAFSLSTSSPQKLGERIGAFESDLRAALAKLSPEGGFTEIADMGALIARRS